MDTNEYNSTRQSGEKAVGSGVGAEQSQQQQTRFTPPTEGGIKSLGEFNELQRRRGGRRPVFSGGTPAARDALANGVREQIEADNAEPKEESEQSGPLTPDPQGEQKPNYDIDPALADPWDLTPEQRAAARAKAAAEGDPFAPFREGKGHALEMPTSVQSFSEEDASNLSDFSFVAAREGWSKEFAQSLVDQAAADFLSEKSRPGPEGNYDPERTVSELRFEWGEATESTLYEIAAFCEKRPALSAFLDSTGLGSSPTMLRMLAAAAKEPALLTRAGAKKFVDSLGQNEKYWQGDRIELAKAKLAFQIADAQ